MDSNDEIIYDSEGYIRIYKSGRAERFHGLEFVPPSSDPVTGVSSKDANVVPGVTARLYMPKLDSDKKLPILVHFHGGAFCMGSSFDPLAHNYITSLVARANVVAVSVNYRLAPENYLPAAYEDSYAALDWVLSHKNDGPEPWLTDHGDFTHVYTSGESSGANIAHHVAMYGGSKLCGAVLIHPYFLSSEKVESDEFNPALADKLVQLWKIVCPTTIGLDDPWINPLAADAPPLATLGCKRVLILVGGADTLRDRGRAYCEKLKESEWKGEVKYWEAPGEGHGFFVFKPKSELSEAQDQIIADFVNKV
ncbi:alpha/beta-Hydrolases superfamily protein [Rhynchospora pubera]|uniref:Alpha/beta-Hydrolases superfamily protein n=1 Tax=Rhynchospora pubera TaxID=906938 RepID=A0AAV8BSH2_9POAL|nr:alpha/beta-Hydrolases superfamily protein [Rhynchospora pubera]KAJ4801680.1 alpha/beta-Hydrolases superfamily protein [Rhynchospora pubera]